MMKNFNTLSEREILALAISLEEEDERVYADFAEGLKQGFPASASVFDAMRGDESGHRRRLIELYRQGRFPFDKLAKFYPFDQINEAVRDSESGVTLKPILTFPK